MLPHSGENEIGLFPATANSSRRLMSSTLRCVSVRVARAARRASCRSNSARVDLRSAGVRSNGGLLSFSGVKSGATAAPVRITFCPKGVVQCQRGSRQCVSRWIVKPADTTNCLTPVESFTRPSAMAALRADCMTSSSSLVLTERFGRCENNCRVRPSSGSVSPHCRLTSRWKHDHNSCSRSHRNA